MVGLGCARGWRLALRWRCVAVRTTGTREWPRACENGKHCKGLYSAEQRQAFQHGGKIDRGQIPVDTFFVRMSKCLKKGKEGCFGGNSRGRVGN